ncbi:ATP-dependent helicase HrpB [Xylanibacillus composti]|uniref:ATP-dependent helicase HrpB n=1 Tax=Xylanibacillus composti TaxID=1572762 RepID=A0A8J4M2Y7_9BACL|nr:ATP-dependent helicase HrpB [Xylanibacillus composti]MDT9724605.1 ATP-dependent helicase HrpB [Xylanibacillus composti]GIQ70219.1 ATP-dependent helicase HrpB [Xylanibacillus composti]
MRSLPIHTVLPELKACLAQRNSAVLVAAPGAGKTTQVPLSLLDEPWLNGRKILMLEPRRIAARSAAAYMARLLGERVGGTVGYRMKHESRISANTRIEVITEGILARMLQQDPALEQTGAVLFDEFHERSLQADLGLALCLEAQSALREDLRILVMSATLEAEPVAQLLGQALVIRSEGSMYPVATRYAEKPLQGRLEEHVVRWVSIALAQEQGDMLVFLPGAREIRRTARLLAERLPPDQVPVPLYGGLSLEEQQRALEPSPHGRRKIVLATSIAETSLTVEGIRIVVDAGWMRVPRFSPRTGMTHLDTVRVSRASADQRRGRAGRLAPGICYRLWTEAEDRALAERGEPEIRTSDLASLALELSAWGVAEPEQLAWLDPPPKAAYAQACELLEQLGALRPDRSITAHGRDMAALGVHPRLAHMMLRAEPLGLAAEACQVAALLGERDIASSRNGVDLRRRLEELNGQATASHADESALQRIRKEAGRLLAGLNRMGSAEAEADKPVSRDAAQPLRARIEPERCGELLALAFPERVAQRRADGRYVMANGRGAALPDGDSLGAEPYLAVAELDDAGTEGRIMLAAPLSLKALETLFADQITEGEEVYWHMDTQAVRARRLQKLGAMVLREQPIQASDPEQVAAALLAGIQAGGLDMLPWTRSARRLQQRIVFLRRFEPDLPDVSGEALLDDAQHWLLPHLYGRKSRGDLHHLSMDQALEAMLSWPQRAALEEQAPTHLTVPSGSRIPIDYSNPDQPVLAVRLQEMFGLAQTPRIANGRQPLLLHLLSPAQRPVQVTTDLASFWREAYFEVRKDLKGRYPKHYWPDDPLEAVPTRRAKPSSSRP